jgi:hypothetical protein
MSKITTILMMVLFSVHGIFATDLPTPPPGTRPGPPPPPPVGIDENLFTILFLALFLGYYLSNVYVPKKKSL